MVLLTNYMMIFIVVISKGPQGSFKKKYFNEVLKTSIISGNSVSILYKSKEKKINQSQLNIKKNTFQVLGQSISHPSVYIKPLNN